jgi:two-component system, LuxR family, response regulator FixJ
MANSMLVHVVDDDQAMRQSLEFLLDSAGFEVRLYESAKPLLDALESLSRGCVLTDIRMPGVDGLELLRRIQANGKAVPVIVMTGHGDVPLAVEAMKLGAHDFVEKPFEDESLLTALRSAFQERTADQSVDPALAEFKTRLATLSQRERQVMAGLIAGDANKVMALNLEISPRTVEIYRAKLMSKMQAGSVSELIRLAVRAGIA